MAAVEIRPVAPVNTPVAINFLKLSLPVDCEFFNVEEHGVTKLVYIFKYNL